MYPKGEMLTKWLATIQEGEYLRVIFVGKLQIHSGVSKGSEEDTTSTRLSDMMNEIWKVSKTWNSSHRISGHLSWSNDLHVCQLIEGKEKDITSLMSKIRKDPRITIYKEFEKRLKTMKLSGDMTMCYSFEVAMQHFLFLVDENTTPEQMFRAMKNTYEAMREGWKLNEFYKKVVDTFLMKFISVREKELRRNENQ